MTLKTKVILGMSGGVDSSVAGLLLKQAGYEVQGVMLRTWRYGQKPDVLSASEQDIFDSATRSAEAIGIPLIMVDARDSFQREVIGYFKTSLSTGLTPNPCMICNREVKWKILLDIADKQEAAWVSTGHYARLMHENGEVRLVKGRDTAKDQTYFLSHLSQAILKRTLFPLGDYIKKEIRLLAREFHIEAVDRPESQDLCFLEGTDYRTFFLDQQPDAFKTGEIVDPDGEVLGSHTGLANYTIGQRKGLGVFRSKPLYVIRKDFAENRLVVGFSEQLGTKRFIVQQVNWVSGHEPAEKFHAQLKIRYQSKPLFSEICWLENDRYEVIPDQVMRDVTPGQFAVFYDGDTVLGGGTISSAILNEHQ